MLDVCVCVRACACVMRQEDQGGRYKYVCAVDALRELGATVPYTCNGPFFILHDCNAMLRPFGLYFMPVAYTAAELPDGKYVLCKQAHASIVC